MVFEEKRARIHEIVNRAQITAFDWLVSLVPASLHEKKANHEESHSDFDDAIYLLMLDLARRVDEKIGFSPGESITREEKISYLIEEAQLKRAEVIRSGIEVAVFGFFTPLLLLRRAHTIIQAFFPLFLSDFGQLLEVAFPQVEFNQSVVTFLLNNCTYLISRRIYAATIGRGCFDRISTSGSIDRILAQEVESILREAEEAFLINPDFIESSDFHALVEQTDSLTHSRYLEVVSGLVPELAIILASGVTGRHQEALIASIFLLGIRVFRHFSEKKQKNGVQKTEVVSDDFYDRSRIEVALLDERNKPGTNRIMSGVLFKDLGNWFGGNLDIFGSTVGSALLTLAQIIGMDISLGQIEKVSGNGNRVMQRFHDALETALAEMESGQNWENQFLCRTVDYFAKAFPDPRGVRTSLYFVLQSISNIKPEDRLKMKQLLVFIKIFQLTLEQEIHNLDLMKRQDEELLDTQTLVRQSITYALDSIDQRLVAFRSRLIKIGLTNDQLDELVVYRTTHTREQVFERAHEMLLENKESE